MTVSKLICKIDVTMKMASPVPNDGLESGVVSDPDSAEIRRLSSACGIRGTEAMLKIKV